MTSQYRHRRTSISSASFPNPIEPGEIAVNTANRQIAVGDAASASVGAPKNLLAIRIFDTSAQYAIGDLVTNNANLYRAKVAIVPGPFVLTQWDDVGGLATINDNPPQGVPGRFWWESDTGILWVYYDDGNSTQWVQIGSGSTTDPSKVSIAGDTMQNYLIIHGTVPTLYLDKAGSGSGQFSAVKGGNNLKDRWQVALGNTVAETGGNAGSNFEISRMNDAGAYIDSPLQVFRSSGIVDFLQKPTVGGQIFAAPFDALAYNGMQVNGSMEVNQVGAAFVATSGAQNYLIDSWKLGYTGTGATVYTGTNTGIFPNFPNNIYTQNAVASVSTGAGDVTIYRTVIEGYRIVRLNWGTTNAQPLTVGFWIYVEAAGTMSVSLINPATNRCIVSAVSVVGGGVQYKTVTFVGDTTGASWNITNGAGVMLNLCIAAGANYKTGTLDTWQNGGPFYAATAQTNFHTAVGSTTALTGVVVLPGLEAPSAARSAFIMRPYDQELLTCKRYWEKVNNLYQAYVPAASLAYSILTPWSVSKRATPTVAGIHVGGSAFPAAIGSLTADGSTGVIETRTSTALSNTGYFQSTITGDARL